MAQPSFRSDATNRQFDQAAGNERTAIGGIMRFVVFASSNLTGEATDTRRHAAVDADEEHNQPKVDR